MPAPGQIVLLSTDFRPMLGGVADYLHQLADATAATIPVTVLSSAPQKGLPWPHAYALESLPPPPERRLNASFGDGFPPMRRIRTGAHFLRLRRYGDRTIRQIRRRWPDAAVLIGIWDVTAHFWMAACRRARVPYSVFTYGVELLMPLYGGLPAWRKRDFGGAAHVIACSRATGQLAAERLGLTASPAIVNPPIAPPDGRGPIARRHDELKCVLPSHGGPVLLSVGRLVPRKGFDLVIRSVAQLRADFPGLQYVVVGDGPERSSLERLTRENGLVGHVHFLGAVDDLTKWAAYDLCDVFVMPSRLIGGRDWEGFGIVFLEAALAGRPSVGGRTGGIADAVADGQSGLLVDPESPHELTAALQRLLADRALRERLGRCGEQLARTRFTAAAAAESLRTQLGWN